METRPKRLAHRLGVGFALALFAIGNAATCALAGSDIPTGGSSKGAALAAARGEVDRARTNLRLATEKVRSTWKANPQMIAAMDDVTAARKDYQAARAALVEKLKADPAYAAALKSQTDVQGRLHDEQAKTNAAAPATTKPAGAVESAPNLPAPSANQVATAQEKLDNKTKLRNMEDTAVTGDPAAAKAQAKLNEAEKAAKVWQAQLDAALKNDPDYRAALDQMTAARSRFAAAGGTPDDNGSAYGSGYDNYGGTIYGR